MVCIFIILIRLNAGSKELINPVHDKHVRVSDYDCPPWHFFNKNDGRCECYKLSKEVDDVIKCREFENGVTLLKYGQCITHDKNTGTTVIAKCPYFHSAGHNISEVHGYITLPSNISDLNDYMCGPMNRRGSLCNKCIDNFGPSATSFLYTCSNCTRFSTAYGILLYIFIEVIPITILYLIILIFRINLTSSPMTGFVLYSHLIMNAIIIDLRYPITEILYQTKYFRIFVIALYGMWNLDFFKFILPPFCLSSHLKQTHIALFGYISVIYPLCLIIITLICIELHGRNVLPIVWLWRPFHKYFVKLRKEWNTKSDIIDVFATFLLLSCSKLMYQSVLLIQCSAALRANSTSGDVSITFVAGNDLISPCGSIQHLSFAIPACLIMCLALLLILLLILHPFKWFRDCCCFSKCELLNQTCVNIFVEKFHSCYRNGLDGGRDMRSFSGLYFGLRVLSTIYLVTYRFLPQWTYEGILFMSTAMLIALVRPYKKTYMNVLDSLLLSLLTVNCLLLSISSKYSTIRDIEVFIISLIPAIIFWLFLAFKLIFKLWKRIRRCYFVTWKKIWMFKSAAAHSQEDQLLTQPTSTTVTIADVCSYGSIHS